VEKSTTAARWREMAEHIRAKAEAMPVSEAKRSMLNVAEGYEKMAARAEYRESRGPSNAKRS
jgi:hypothetical protein